MNRKRRAIIIKSVVVPTFAAIALTTMSCRTPPSSQDDTPPRALAGTITIHHKEKTPPTDQNYPELMNPGLSNTGPASDGRVLRGVLNGRVEFEESFAETPVVFIALSALDFIKDRNSRISVRATKVDVDGFDYEFVTWADTKLWYAQASWLAVSGSDWIIHNRLIIENIMIGNDLTE